VLDDSGVVRGDIRSSFGSSTTTAEGVPLAIRLTVRDAASGDAVEGAGVYLWHCDRDGRYSLYSQGVTGENYLRGAQEADADGTVGFTSPKEACEAVYATSGYEQSVANLSQVSLAGDNVFGDDGGIHQLATMSGDPTGGYTAALTIGI
jgi:hypothetical protein